MRTSGNLGERWRTPYGFRCDPCWSCGEDFGGTGREGPEERQPVNQGDAKSDEQRRRMELHSSRIAMWSFSTNFERLEALWVSRRWGLWFVADF